MSEQITTPEDLDALPVGIVVRLAGGLVAEKRPTGRWAITAHRGPQDLRLYDLPATVLYRPDAPAPSVSAAHALAKMTALSGGDAQAIVAAATALTTPSVDAEQALLRIKRFAEASAVTERARGRAEEERSWLDVLAIIERAEATP